MDILNFLENKKDQLMEVAENIKENVLDKMSNIESGGYFDDTDFDEEEYEEKRKEEVKKKIMDKNFPSRYLSYEVIKVKDIMEVDTFWKFTQSSPGLSKEGLFKEYKQGRIVEAEDGEEWLSFVGSRDIGKCIGFGDQLTRISFSKNDKDIKKYINNSVVFLDNEYCEMRTKMLKADRQFSLSEPETIAKIIDMSSVQSLRVFFKNTFCNVSDMLEAYQFFESLDFVNYLLSKYDLRNEDNIKELKRNVYFSLEAWRTGEDNIEKETNKETDEIDLNFLSEAIIEESMNSASNTITI